MNKLSTNRRLKLSFQGQNNPQKYKNPQKIIPC